MNSDFKDLLRLFDKHNVRYLVVGGYAVMHFTEPRYTKDLDVWIALEPEVIERAVQALEEFGFKIAPDQVEAFKKPNHMILLGNPPVRIDILNSLSGVEFEGAYTRRKEVQIGDLTAYFIGLPDLIEAKRSAGRPQDLLDLKKLEQALKRRKNN